MKSKFEIDDRTGLDPEKCSFVGRFVLFEIRQKPFPHGLYAGDFATRKEAEAKRRELLKQVVS